MRTPSSPMDAMAHERYGGGIDAPLGRYRQQSPLVAAAGALAMPPLWVSARSRPRIQPPPFM